MPQIGCGLAGGDWNIISKIIESECTNVFPVVYLHIVQNLPSGQNFGLTMEYMKFFDPTEPDFIY